jgi:hypothetical protein
MLSSPAQEFLPVVNTITPTPATKHPVQVMLPAQPATVTVTVVPIYQREFIRRLLLSGVVQLLPAAAAMLICLQIPQPQAVTTHIQAVPMLQVPSMAAQHAMLVTLQLL